MVTPRRHPEDPYAAIASLYDIEHVGYDDDLDLYLNLAVATGDPILELGCGTGRLLIPLAEAGHRVTGIDLSRPMLDRARQFAETAGVLDRVTLQRGAMTDADLAPGGPFGLVIVAINGLLHLPTAAAQREAFAAARRALDPRGQLVIDVLNPTPDTLRGFDQSLVHEGTWHDAAGDRVDKFAARRLSAARQTIETELWYERIGPEGVVRRTTTSYQLRYVYRAELDLMLELAGFAEWQVYGSYDLDPYDDGADRIVVTAEVTASSAPPPT